MIKETTTLVGQLIPVTKQHTVEICVSEESLDLITDNIIVVLILSPQLEDLLDLSQYRALVVINTGVLVIWLAVLVTQHFLEEADYW